MDRVVVKWAATHVAYDFPVASGGHESCLHSSNCKGISHVTFCPSSGPSSSAGTSITSNPSVEQSQLPTLSPSMSTIEPSKVPTGSYSTVPSAINQLGCSCSSTTNYSQGYSSKPSQFPSLPQLSSSSGQSGNVCGSTSDLGSLSQCDADSCSPQYSTRSDLISGNDVPCEGYYKIENGLSPQYPETTITRSWFSTVAGMQCIVTLDNIK